MNAKSWNEMYADAGAHTPPPFVGTADVSFQPMIRDEGRDYPVLVCPVCGSEWTHVGPVALLDSSKESVTLTAGGEDGEGRITVERGIHNEPGRRDTVRLNAWCEDGHEWRMDFRQVKGITEIQTTRLSDPLR